MSEKNILIADDSAMVRNHLVCILEAAGFRMSEASDGLEALAALKQKKFDLLILDLEMPKLSGFELLRIVKGDVHTQKTRILCITSVYTKLGDVHKVMELGAKGYIQKNCTPEDLLFRVDQAFQD